MLIGAVSGDGPVVSSVVPTISFIFNFIKFKIIILILRSFLSFEVLKLI